MPTNIIQLVDFRPVAVSPNGVEFPQVYRVNGYSYKEDTYPADDPDFRYPHGPYYTLYKNADCGLAGKTVEPVRVPDPVKDIGWVTVRFHPNEDSVSGWLDGSFDYCELLDDTGPSGSVFRTKQGLFTVAHRQFTIPPNRPQPLFIYADRVHDPRFRTLPWSKVIDSHGAELSDEVLLPECGKNLEIDMDH